ncbi:MAG: glycoside hydrolase family 2 protein [Clostridia bacterium]|nr:glycoside hydrolase family 2 protein [Clostridia bacterium]
MKSYNLNGQWNMTRVATGEKYNVNIPSDNYTQLLELGAIPDPYYKDNEKLVEWIGREDWTYERTFTLNDDDLNNRKILLVCKALDTLCDVYVNDKIIGKGENAHLKYEFDIKDVAKSGENTLKITFFAPTTYAEKMQKEKPIPKNCNGTDGAAYIRKPHCHFGWDWGPHLPLSGITDDIWVECFDNRLTDVEIKQIHENGKVTVKINPIIDGDGEVTAKIICPDGTEYPIENNEIVIENPELWWTKELSDKEKQPLYTVVATMGDSVVSKKIGLRTICLDRSKDKYGHNFCFYLNGVPIFGKGADWILPDSLMGRVTNETYDYYIDSALDANFNMLRIWGGAYYTPDYFLEQCDEKGLLIWQDFMFACLMYPFYEDNFRENVLKEIKYQIMRIKSHPCLCLWGGNNEIETMFAYMPETMKIVQWYKKFFYEILKDLVTDLDPDTPYIETSPIGESFRKGVTGDNHGDTHMWTVWHGQKPLNYYRTRPTRFCSEFGLESLPSMDAVRQFAEESDYFITSDIFNSHQKCRNGNRKMLYYLLEKFYEPEKFEDLIYMTNLIQKECIQDATEHWRRHRERCNGSLFWQYNDCWQAPSWSSVDYTGKWKALQYAARHFFEPVCVSIEETDKDYKVYILNDTLKERNVKVSVCLSTLDGKVLYKNTNTVDLTVKVGANARVMFEKGNIAGDKKDMFLSVKLYENENVISERTKIFVPDRDLKLKPNTIQKSVSYENGEIIVKMVSPVFCRSVMVDIEDFREPFSDNYFDLLPNEEKVVTVKAEKLYDVTVKSLADIPVKGSKFKTALFRTKFFMEPENLANWFYYSTN